MSNENKTSRVKTRCKITLGVLYLVIVILYAFFLFTNLESSEYEEDAKMFGRYMYTISDSSHSAVVADPKADVKADDTIVFKNDDAFCTGMVERMSSGNTARVKNEQNGETDYIKQSDVYGVVHKKIPYFGWVISFLKSYWGIIFIIALPCFIFLMLQVIRLIRFSREQRQNEEYKEEFAFSPIHRKEKAPFVAEQNTPEEEEPVSYSPSESFSTPSSFEADYERTRRQIEEEEKKVLMGSSKKSDYNHQEPDNARLNEFLQQSEPFLDNTLGELHYKMKFQDTKEVSKYQEAVIEEGGEAPNFDKYGLQTSPIEDGVEIKIDPKSLGSCVLRLKNDGSLQIVTESYVANIDATI